MGVRDGSVLEREQVFHDPGEIGGLGEAAKGKQNLMPYILNAVESYATLGEISDTLRHVFGEY